MWIDVQFDPAILTAAIKARVAGTTFCPGQEISLQNEVWVLDRIRIDTATFESKSSAQDGFLVGANPVVHVTDGEVALPLAKQLIVRQGLMAFLIKRSRLVELNTQNPTLADYLHGNELGGVPLSAVFAVRAVIENKKAVFKLEFRKLQIGAVIGFIDAPQEIQQLIAQNIPDLSSPINLPSMAGIDFTPLNAGIALSADGTTVALRLEVPTRNGAEVAAWTAFYDGNFPVGRGNRPFSIGVQWQLMGDLLAQKVTDGIADYNSVRWYGIDIDSGPTTTWDPGWPLSPAIHLDMDATQEQACLCLLWPVDLSFNATMSATFTAPATNTLRITIEADTTIEDGDQVCCVGTAITPHGWVMDVSRWGFPLLSLVQLFLFPVLGSLEVFFAAFGGLAFLLDSQVNDQLDKVSFDNATIGTNSDGNTTLDLPFKFPSLPLLGKPAITEVYGTPTELTLSGTIGSPAVVKQAILHVEASPFVLDFGDDPCGAPLLAYRTIIDLKSSGGILHICSVTVHDDPAHQFDVPTVLQIVADGLKLLEAGAIVLEIPQTALKPDYVNVRYPLKLTIVTSGGVREVTVPALPIPSAAELSAKQNQFQTWKGIHCHTFVNQWHGPMRVYVPKWTPDPAPPGIDQLHLWQFVMSGLADQDGFGVAIGESAHATVHETSGTARWSTLLAPAASAQLGVSRVMANRSITHARAAIPDLQLVQTPLDRVGTVAVGKALRSPLIENASTVICADGESVTAFAFASPGRKAWAVEVPAIGVIRAGDALVAWGPRGMWRIDRHTHAVRTITETPTTAVIVRGPRVLASHPDHLAVFSRALEPVERVVVAAGRGLAVIDKVLLIAGPDGIHLARFAERTPIAITDKLAGDDVAPILLPQGMRAAWVARGRGGQVIVASALGTLTAATYATGHPWNLPAAVARLGDTVAIVEGAQLALYRARPGRLCRSL